jgi:hypothetical protein
VRAADLKPLDDWFQQTPEADNCRLNLSRLEACEQAVRGVSAAREALGHVLQAYRDYLLLTAEQVMEPAFQ